MDFSYLYGICVPMASLDHYVPSQYFLVFIPALFLDRIILPYIVVLLLISFASWALRFFNGTVGRCHLIKKQKRTHEQPYVWCSLKNQPVRFLTFWFSSYISRIQNPCVFWITIVFLDNLLASINTGVFSVIVKFGI